MSRIWQILLGIDDRSAGGSNAGATSRLELTALPGGSLALGLAVLTLAALVLLWWLPRREKRDLSRPKTGASWSVSGRWSCWRLL